MGKKSHKPHKNIDNCRPNSHTELCFFFNYLVYHHKLLSPEYRYMSDILTDQIKQAFTDKDAIF